MTYDMTPGQPSPSRRPSGDVLLSRADLTAAMRELDSLRGAHRIELAERLRAARAYGTAGNDDDHLAVLEDAAVERIKIAQLERLIASATVVRQWPRRSVHWPTRSTESVCKSLRPRPPRN